MTYGVAFRFGVLSLFGFVGMTVAHADGGNPSHENILYIGDSHSVGTFGKVEDAELRKLGTFGVATYASCGSSPIWWSQGTPTTCGFFSKDLSGTEVRLPTAPTPKITDLLALIKPKYTVVEQGTNLHGYPLTYAASSSAALAKTIVAGGSQCIWIGPPTSRKFPEPGASDVWNSIRTAVAPYCATFDSRPYTSYPATGGDGLHFDSLGPAGVAIATNWAQSIFDDYSSLLK